MSDGSPAPPTLTKSTSFWFGEGASADWRKARIADALTLVLGLAGGTSGLLFFLALSGMDLRVTTPVLPLLFDVFIPGLAGVALLCSFLLGTRAVVRIVEDQCRRPSGSALPRFGRKGLLVTGSSSLFAISCFYRALFIADEGAALCRGAATAFNAPASGRAIATVGEIALVVQMSLFIEELSARLGATRGRLWRGFYSKVTRARFTTIGPVLVAETLSWSGVLSGDSRFYCAEYVCWCVIAFTWAWDAAECLHVCQTKTDAVTSAAILTGGLALLFFNCAIEIPHFFRYERPPDAEGARVPGIWECVQDETSPLWLKRLPFFVCYFIGCSWASVAITYRFLRLAPVRRKQN